MNYISFYRKWRPQSFKDIIGQDYIVKTLRNAVSKNRLSHSYIFCGPRGTGKTSLARILAKAINCVKGPTPDPCNKCSNCIGISSGSSIDVIEIDAASNRGIDEIRELREKVKYLPVELRKKVYIIDEVHMLTIHAFNALLKVLEEPPYHVLFIMATTEPHKVISTIMSRCQRFDFYPIPVDKIKKRLEDISQRENIVISDSALNIISKYADGSQRDADGILEQLASYSSDRIDVNDVTSLLGVVDFELLFEFTNIFIEKNLNQALLFIDRLIKSSYDLKIFVSEFIDFLYNLYVIKNFDNPWDILDISIDYQDRYLSKAKQISKKEINFLMDLFTDLYKQIKWTESQKILFKSSVIKAINTNILETGSIEENDRLKKIENDLEVIKKEIEGIKSYRHEDILNVRAGADNIDDTSKGKLESKKKVSNKKDVKIGKNAAQGYNMQKEGAKEDEIFSNWDNICLNLKSKKISVYAMFTEAKWCKLDNNILYFYLNSNKKWHMEHLNRKNNIDLVTKVIKEVIGKDYRIKFELEENRKDIDKNKKNNNKSLKIKQSKDDKEEGEVLSKDKQNKSDFKENKNNKNKKELKDDIFDYFEKKFEIKE